MRVLSQGLTLIHRSWADRIRVVKLPGSMDPHWVSTALGQHSTGSAQHWASTARASVASAQRKVRVFIRGGRRSREK
jgi:hypothetical protein